jgi:hypothetical protein
VGQEVSDDDIGILTAAARRDAKLLRSDDLRVLPPVFASYFADLFGVLRVVLATPGSFAVAIPVISGTVARPHPIDVFEPPRSYLSIDLAGFGLVAFL